MKKVIAEQYIAPSVTVVKIHVTKAILDTSTRVGSSNVDLTFDDIDDDGSFWE